MLNKLSELADLVVVKDDFPTTLARVGVLVAAAAIASSLPTMNIDQRTRLGAKRIVEEVFGAIADDDSGMLGMRPRVVAGGAR